MHSRRDMFGLAVMMGASTTGVSAATLQTCGGAAIIETRPEPAAPPLRDGLATSGSAKLWWWDTGGKGVPIVLLHPATGSGKIWRYQQQAFVDAGFRVIGYSGRGAEGSDAGQPGDKTSATDDLRAVLAHLDVKRCHLVGTAAGAFAAVDFAYSSPEMLKSVTFANSMLGVTGAELEPMLKGLQMSAVQTLPVEMRELGPAYRAGNPTGTARWIEYTHGSSSARARTVSPEPSSGLGASGPTAAGRPSPPPAPSSRLTLENLRSIKTPTLLIAGDADMLAPPPLVARFASYLPNCRMTRLPACGHSGYWEAPDLFNEAVLSFVKNVEKQGRA